MASSYETEVVLYEISKLYRRRAVRLNQDYNRYGYTVQFDNGDMVMIDGYTVDDIIRRCQMPNRMVSAIDATLTINNTYYNQAQYGTLTYPLPECRSCGKNAKHEVDHHGFCPEKQKEFWGKVRKLYWHRYSKNEQNKILQAKNRTRAVRDVGNRV